MTTNHHTVIATGAAANASVFNAPMSQLDTAITTSATAIAANALLAAATTAEVVAARDAHASLDTRLDFMQTVQQLAGGNVATKANGVSAAGQKVLTVDATTGFIVGAYVTYLLNGTTLEGNTIGSIQAGVSLTLGTNIGTGGVLDDSYISMISTSEYLAAQAIPHAGTLMLPQAMEYANGGVFNVRAYGASPAASAAVNDEAFQTAINAAATVGGVVDIPPGQYQVSNISFASKNSVTLRGAGQGATTLQFSATSGNVFDLTGASFICVENMTITPYAVKKTAGSLFYLDAGAGSCMRNVFRNLIISSAYKAFTLNNCTTTVIENVQFMDYSADYTWDYYIGLIGATTSTRISDVGGFTVAGLVSAGLVVSGGNVDTLLVSNSGWDVPAAISGTGVNISSGEWMFFSNCTFESGTTSDAVIISGGQGIHFTACHFLGYRGLWITGGKALTISGGEILVCEHEGVVLASGAANVKIIDVTISTIGQATTNTYSGVFVGAGTSEFEIRGCTIGNQIFASAKVPKYGVHVEYGASNHYVIMNNYLRDFGTSGIEDAGTGTNKIVTSNLIYA